MALAVGAGKRKKEMRMMWKRKMAEALVKATRLAFACETSGATAAVMECGPGLDPRYRRRRTGCGDGPLATISLLLRAVTDCDSDTAVFACVLVATKVLKCDC